MVITTDRQKIPRSGNSLSPLRGCILAIAICLTASGLATASNSAVMDNVTGRDGSVTGGLFYPSQAKKMIFP